MIAVLTVRDGRPASGSEESLEAAGGRGLVAGDGVAAAAGLLAEWWGEAHTGGEEAELRTLELAAGAGPARLAGTVAPFVVAEGAVVLPASPDGRDLAPRLAHQLGWPLLAGAVRVTATGAVLARMNGQQLATFSVNGPFVATLLPGARSVVPAAGPIGSGDGGRRSSPATGGPPQAASPPRGRIVRLEVPSTEVAPDPEMLATTPPDPATMSLAEAPRILVAGGGLGGGEHVALLEEVAARLGASIGGTRVVTDAGWLEHDRQIGTTGASVAPRCCVAFGVSGAAQHVAGLGTPLHVVAVNRDVSCPMMAMADLALVTDAPALVEALARRLGLGRRAPTPAATGAPS